MSGKVKSLHGVYKALGRDAFLAAARMYSDHVQKTVEATLAEMESRWYDVGQTMTEAEKMVDDFRKGQIAWDREGVSVLAQPELRMRGIKMDNQNKQQKYVDKVNRILSSVDFNRLDCSCNSSYSGYARSILRALHKAFVSVYHTDYLDRGGYRFVELPAVIRGRNTGHISLGIVTLDMESSGKHFGTFFLTPHGVIDQGDENLTEKQKEYLRKTFIPYDYWYTPELEHDIHVDYESIPPEVAELLEACPLDRPGMEEKPGHHLKME